MITLIFPKVTIANDFDLFLWSQNYNLIVKDKICYDDRWFNVENIILKFFKTLENLVFYVFYLECLLQNIELWFILAVALFEN